MLPLRRYERISNRNRRAGWPKISGGRVRPYQPFIF